MVAAYDPGVLPAAQIAETQRLATSEHRGSLTGTAFDGDMGAPLVLNAWGARQPCSRMNAAALARFVAAFADPAAASDHANAGRP